MRKPRHGPSTQRASHFCGCRDGRRKVGACTVPARAGKLDHRQYADGPREHQERPFRQRLVTPCVFGAPAGEDAGQPDPGHTFRTTGQLCRCAHKSTVVCGSFSTLLKAEGCQGLRPPSVVRIRLIDWPGHPETRPWWGCRRAGAWAVVRASLKDKHPQPGEGQPWGRGSGSACIPTWGPHGLPERRGRTNQLIKQITFYQVK